MKKNLIHGRGMVTISKFSPQTFWQNNEVKIQKMLLWFASYVITTQEPFRK